MQEKLDELFSQCCRELQSIGLDLSSSNIGKVNIKISKRNNKRYGCCKQEEPDSNYKVIKKVGRRRCVKYEKFNKHTIEISKWVLSLNDEIIKNTIMHELIHCFPFCNNHGKQFKLYANFINSRLGYDISRLGNKEEDYGKSNLEYEAPKYKYVIKCSKCGKVFYRNRISKDFFRKYRCVCKGKLVLG